MPTTGDIIAIDRLLLELDELRQERIDEASEGFGVEGLAQAPADAISTAQRRQALEMLSLQYNQACAEEAQLKVLTWL